MTGQPPSVPRTAADLQQWMRHDPPWARAAIDVAIDLLRRHLAAFDRQFVEPTLRAETAAFLGAAEAAAQPDDEPAGHEHQGHEYTYRAETCPVCHPEPDQPALGDYSEEGPVPSSVQGAWNEAAAQPALLTREALATALRRHQVSMDDAHRRYHCDGTCADAVLAALPPAVPEPLDVERLARALKSRYGFKESEPEIAIFLRAIIGTGGIGVTPAEQRARPWTTEAMDAEEGQR
jgi:hypothetical protein